MVTSDDNMPIAGGMGASANLWQSGIDMDVLLNLQDQMGGLARALRKRFCHHYSEHIGQRLKHYFRKNAWH